MTRPISISLPIASRRRAFDFYRAAFGLEPVGEPAADGIPEPLQFALGNTTTLMLVPAGGFGWVVGEDRIAPAGCSECLLSLAAESPEAVEAAVRAAQAAGARIVSAPEQKPWGYCALVADPDDHLWMVISE